MKRSTAPYFTTARYPGTCAETGQQIKRGDRVAFYPASRKVFSEASKTAEGLRSLNFSQAHCMADANY